MEQHYYNDFSYLIKPSPISGKCCVEVSFRCNDKTVKHYVFIKEGPGVDYFKEAKKIIDSEIASGKLYEISQKYHAPNLKPLFITFATVCFAVACSLGGLVVYKHLNSGGGVVPPPTPPGPVPPTPVTDTVELIVTNPQLGYSATLTNESSTVGSEYKTDITLNHPQNIEYVLPDALDRVMVNDSQITSGYTYDLGSDKLSANFIIPANLVTGKIKITLTLIEALPPGYKKLKLESSNLWLCDQNDTHLINNEIAFDTSKECIVRIEKPTQSNVTSHVPLNIKVTTDDSELFFGDDYQYYFIDDEIAEFKINNISKDVTITAEETDAYAQFLYVAPAHSELDVTLSYETLDSGVNIPNITWGDNSGTLQTTETMEVGKEYKLAHTFSNKDDVDKEYFISVKGNRLNPNKVPELIGFDVHSNVNDNYDNYYNYVDIAAPIADYASGIGNIEAARLTTAITSLVDDGLAYTNINSLFIPSTMSMYYGPLATGVPCPSDYFAFCSNLDSIYVGANNLLMLTNDKHDMLFQYYYDGNEKLSLFLAANNRTDEGVIIDKCWDLPVVNIFPFAFAGRAAKNITIGPSVEQAADGTLAFCSGLETINVDSTNTSFVTNKEPDKPINMLVKNNGYIIATTNKTDFTQISNNEIQFRSYSVSGSNTLSTISLPNTVTKVELYMYSIYHTDNLKTVALNTNVYWNIYGRNFMPMIYNCEGLTNITFGKITNTKLLDSAVIQKCPDVETLLITDDSGRPFTYQNAIYYSEGYEDRLLILIGTCKNSVLYDYESWLEGYYIKDYVPYVFNGNNFGGGSDEGVNGEIYIPKDTTDINQLAFVGISGDATISFKVDTGHSKFRVDNTLLFTEDPDSKELALLKYAMLGKGAKELVVKKSTEADDITFKSYCMNEESYLESIKIEKNTMLVKETFENVTFEANAFYNCPNLKTIDLSGLADNYVPKVDKTSFIQSECSPYNLSKITVIVNPKSEEEFRNNEVWGQFDIRPVNI